MAYDNGAWCAPVGIAWRRVRAERPDYVLYAQDCFHPGPLGSYLQGKGVSADQISIVSYGKEKPAVLGHDEAAYAKNRRAVLVY